MNNVILIEGPITATEFIEFRKLMGGPDIDMPAALKSVSNALLTVCLREDGRLLGFARVVGDGVLYFYVSDVVIHPSLRSGGYGALLMNSVLGYLKGSAVPGATIVVVPLAGLESFYERFGFKRCPDGHFGIGMHLPLPDSHDSG